MATDEPAPERPPASERAPEPVPTPASEPAADDLDLRVSDAERQAVVDRLSRAVGDGMVTLDEFADHAGAAYAARTRAELDAVTRDLRLPVAPPAPGAAATPTSSTAAVEKAAEPDMKRHWVVAIMGGEERKGRWKVRRRQGAFALMGGVELDLRDAQLEADEVEITAWAIMGGVEVIVPEGIEVESSGFMLMGGRTNRVKGTPLPGAPVVRVKGYGLWGGVEVRSKGPASASGEGRRSDRDGERDLRREARRIRHHPMAPRLPIPPIPPTTHVRLPSHVMPLAVPDPTGVLAALGLTTPPPPSEPAPETPVPVPTGIVTVVCTDIVGSTRLSDTLGDQRWLDLLGTHNAAVRAQLARHGGTEVKTSGDGFLVTFASTRSAVAFALDVHDAVRSLDLQLRIGLHAGEVERDGNDIIGRNVAIACRLCDVAAPGEVLASAVVADLADSSSDLAFGADRVLELAGIERPVHARPASRR